MKGVHMIRKMQKMRSLFSRKRVDRVLLAVFFLSFAAVFAMLMIRCPYGYGMMDETFYLLLPRRFLQGDRLLVDEAHLSQFAFLTMVPEMWLYSLFAKTTEGIVLNFRYLYTVLWGAGCLFLFFRTRKINRYAAMCASLFLLPFAPFGIMAFSYNSLGILYQLNAAVFLLCARKKQKLQFTVSGLFFAGAVLCCPYMAVVYVLYSAGLGIARMRGKRPRISWTGADACVCWRYFTLGIGILAALVLSLLFLRSSPEEVIKAFQFAMKDPEHTNFSFISKTGEYLSAIAASNAYFIPMLVILVAMTVLTLYRKRAAWFVIVCASALLFLRRFMVEKAYINYMMFPLTFPGIYILAVTRRKSIRQLGLLWLVPGLLYTFCLNYSSSEFFYAISSASTVSSAAAVFMMWLYCDELKEEYRAGKPSAGRVPVSGRLISAAAYLAVAILCLFQLKYEVPVRWRSVYWEESLLTGSEPRTELAEGPEKGIVCSWIFGEVYNRLYPEVRNIEHKRVLFISEELWMPLVNDNENACFSGWPGRISTEPDSFMERSADYYRRNARKVPELIFLEGRCSRLLKEFPESDYRSEKLPDGSFLITPLRDPDLSGEARKWP